MRKAGGFWTAVAIVAGVVIGVAGPTAAAEPECGMTASGAPAGVPPVRADLTPATADHAITLGRSTEGNRRWDIEFTWTAECVLKGSDINPLVTNLQGSDASVDGKMLTATAVVDGVAHRVRVTLEVPRDPKKVPAGQFEGTLDVGSGAVGLGEATLTIRHQEPLTVNEMSGWMQALWIVVGLMSAVVLFGTQRIANIVGADDLTTPANKKEDRNSQDFTTPLAVIVGALALYPLSARVGGAKAVPWPAWPVWLGAAGLLGGVVVGILKHRDSSEAVALVGGQRFATALLLSFGAGITAWRVTYLNSPDWALTLESALGLVGVVGGATATSALLFLSPNLKPRDEETQLKSEPTTAATNPAQATGTRPKVGTETGSAGTAPQQDIHASGASQQQASVSGP